MGVPNDDIEEEKLPKSTVLIAGGGPVGLLLSKVLSHYGVRSVLFERNATTTKWPKMDLTNVRSMEIFRRLGLAEGLRKQGVPGHIEQPVLISSGFNAKAPITQWNHPGVDSFRKNIAQHNDGTQPLEPWQRLSQAVFEKWLKGLCDEDPLIDIRFGWRIDSVKEETDQVQTKVTDVSTGASKVVISDYAVGCDGASSRIRKSMQIPIDGGPIPACVLLVHFKSKDLARLHKHGKFWHIFMLIEPGVFGGAVIAQDEVDTFTTHLFLPLDVNPDEVESKEAVYKVLGGMNGRYPIEIDEVLVRSVWRPNIAMARSWSGPERRVFIAGDAAHQNIPTGGYGMNTGIQDAYDIGWKLAAAINYAGDGLLDSYEQERRPVVLRSVDRSGVHMAVHESVSGFLAEGDPHRVDADTEEGRKLREKIHQHYQVNDGENTDYGIEMGYRYVSPILCAGEGPEPTWTPSEYTPTSWPGGRPPHLFLSDESAIFDKFGKDWTLLTFGDHDGASKFMLASAETLGVPLVHVDLSKEELATKLYEKRMVLIRPDEHVAWSSDKLESAEQADSIMKLVTGHLSAGRSKASEKLTDKFVATVDLTTQIDNFELLHMGDFQR